METTITTKNIIFTTRTILHPGLDIVGITYVQDIPTNVCNVIQEKEDIQINYICLTHTDYDYILDEIDHRYIIEF